MRPTESSPSRPGGRSPALRKAALFRRRGGFALVEVIVALGIVAVGFLGAFAVVLQSGKMASAAEEDALVGSGLEQRMDQMRTLGWAELTDGTGITGKVWTSRPESVAGITVSRETLTISAYDLATAKILQATWVGTSGASITFTPATEELSAADAVRVIATLTWTGRRSSRVQTRSLVTVISRGGISKSEL